MLKWELRLLMSLGPWVPIQSFVTPSSSSWPPLPWGSSRPQGDVGQSPYFGVVGPDQTIQESQASPFVNRVQYPAVQGLTGAQGAGQALTQRSRRVPPPWDNPTAIPTNTMSETLRPQKFQWAIVGSGVSSYPSEGDYGRREAFYIPRGWIPPRNTVSEIPRIHEPANAPLNVPNGSVSLERLQAEKHKEVGNQFHQLQQYDQAVSEFLIAIASDPSYTDAYYNLGKTYLAMGDDRRASEAFRRLLMITPHDDETRSLLADILSRNGQFDDAKEQYQSILAIHPRFDPAKRSLAWLYFQDMFRVSPQKAQQFFQTESQNNLQAAKAVIRAYYQATQNQIGLKTLDLVQYQFAKTQSVNRSANLAEYDHQDNGVSVIRLTPELAFSDPVVIAAYLSHELVHAADGDAISSILEEQDGYRALAKFWAQHKSDIIEPNLDLALDLYRQSPDRLDLKVRDLYTRRDPLLPEKSPGHGLPLHSMDLDTYNLEKAEKYKDYMLNRIKTLLPTQPILGWPMTSGMVYGLQATMPGASPMRWTILG